MNGSFLQFLACVCIGNLVAFSPMSVAQEIFLQPPEEWASRIPTDGTVCVVPRPTDTMRLFSLVRNNSVATELHLTPERQDAFLAELKSSRNILYPRKVERTTKDESNQRKTAGMKEVLLHFDEILPPEKRKRLEQLNFQIEMHYLGASNSLLRGRLSEVVKVHEGQRTHIKESVDRIEKEMHAEVATVITRYQQRMLRELSTEQRVAAEQALGNAFHFIASPTDRFRR